ncbi:MAG: hypothetical protein JXD18_14135 [Anaerolineae bacterium]|nr:hypothetical protein [Anaerolineae bacterium]
MSKRNLWWEAVLGLTLCALAGGLISCTTPTEVALVGPRAWIDFPRDGASVPVGAAVSVVSHAYAPGGVAEVLLSVNGTAYRRDAPADAGAALVEVRQEWVPQAPGLYTLQVTGYDMAGRAGSPGAITVRAEGEAGELPTPVPAATSAPTATPVPTVVPTATPVPTAVPTVTPVPTPVPTETPVPTPVPTETPVPTLVPTPIPSDTTAPPAPEPYVPADELVLTCRSEQNLVWLPVSDPSGVVYYVKLEYLVSATEWGVVGGYGPLNDKQVTVEVDCGLYYRWAVRAQDGAGNTGDWSEWFHFSVTLD